MAYGRVERKDLDPDFLLYIETKWKKYESALHKANASFGSTRSLFWARKAYGYKVAYDIALAEYDKRVAKDGGVKLAEV